MKSEEIKSAIKDKKPLFFLSNRGVTSDVPVKVVEVTEPEAQSTLVYTKNGGLTARTPEKFFNSQAELGRSLAGETTPEVTDENN